MLTPSKILRFFAENVAHSGVWAAFRRTILLPFVAMRNFTRRTFEQTQSFRRIFSSEPVYL